MSQLKENNTYMIYIQKKYKQTFMIIEIIDEALG